MVLAGPAGPFTLTARADRIDVGDGGLVITDYKTGARACKTWRARATQGEAPQLPLEAAIAAAGGFADVPAGRVDGCATSRRRAASRRARTFALKVDDVAALARRGAGRACSA